MKKLSHIEAIGKIHALHRVGFTEDQIKVAFVNQGVTQETAELLIKEATPWGLIGRGILAGGRMLARGGGRLAAKGGSKLMSPMAQGLGGRAGHMGGRAMQSMGALGQKAGRGIARSGVAFARNPLKAVGGGAMQAGRGMLFGGGKGMGGVVGKGIFGAGTASMLMPGGESPQMPRPYGMYGQQ